MHLDQTQINKQAGNPLKRFRSVSVPEKMLDALQLLRDVGASFWPLLLKSFCRGVRVSDGFFQTLGVTPILGRDFYAGEDAPGAPHTILLMYGAWQKRFGGSRSVEGQTITLNNISYSIIGVLPQDFHFAPIGEADFWAALNDPNDCDKQRGCHGMFGLARLKDGTSLPAAIASLKTEA